MRDVGMLVVVALGLVLTGCGSSGGGGSSGDPVGAVNLLINTMVAKQWDKIPPMLCSAKRDELAAKFDLTKSIGAAPSGVDANAILSSMTIATKDLSVTQSSVSGDNAVVHVKGTLQMSMPDDKLRDYVKAILTASGQTATDEQINQFMTLAKDQFAKGQAMDSDVNVTKEGSAWLVCSDFTSTGS